MVGRISINFHTRVFLTVMVICWVLVGVFMVFQYHREKEFKAKLLDSELQMYNSLIIDGMQDGETIKDIVRRMYSPVEELRITVIGKDGKVIFDNNDSTPFPVSDHNNRPEVVQARLNGEGHSLERHSQSDDVNYFYSAKLGSEGIVVRSAALYTHTLREFLKADGSLIWLMTFLTVLMSLIAYFATRRISTSISRLNRFAEKAERGERIYDDEAFPGDELGSIASHIVRLYVQRDERHREAIRQQQDKIRLKKQLTNNINHELKTPVASILVSLELLRDHPEIEENRKQEFLNRIYANARRLDTLLKDISTITRMDEGADMISVTDVNLKSLVRDVVDSEQVRTKMTIMVDMPDIKVVGNVSLLESIFRNLIDNAISYSGADLLKIECDVNGNFIVSDNGCGIADEHLPHIFERFYRIDKGRSREAGGTGLGLAIVRNAVLIHGGDIRAVNANGLTYYFSIRNRCAN